MLKNNPNSQGFWSTYFPQGEGGIEHIWSQIRRKKKKVIYLPTPKYSPLPSPVDWVHISPTGTVLNGQ